MVSALWQMWRVQFFHRSRSHSRDARTRRISSSRSSASSAYCVAHARGRHHPTLRAVVHMLSSAISSEAYVPSSPASILSAKTPMFVVQIRDGRRLPSESLISASDNLQTSSTFSTGKVSFQSGITDGSESVRVHRISCGCSSVAFLYLHPLLRQEQVRSNNKAATV